jgi:protein-S-isoprenylcysteine O-methyltransferase Ste14
MDQEALSRFFLGGILILFLLVRLFFTIASRVKGARKPEDVKTTVPEGKANFILRRFVLVPALSASFFFLYAHPSWMGLFSIPLHRLGIYLGAILGLCGLVLLIWVHLSLGKQWSAKLQLRNDHDLIQSGPYSRIRHPMYTALFAVYLSLGIVSSNYVILILIVAAVVSIAARIPQEEEMLIARFGEEYKRYQQSTGRLFPKL